MGSQAYSRHGIAGHGSSWGRGGWAGGLPGTGLLFSVVSAALREGGLLGPLGASCYFSAAPQVYRRYSPKASLPEDHQSIITSSLNVSSEHIRKFQTLGEKYITAPRGGMAYKEKTVLSIPHECLDTPAQGLRGRTHLVGTTQQIDTCMRLVRLDHTRHDRPKDRNRQVILVLV